MTLQLIYHSEESNRQNISPFDKAIRELVTGKDILIACPYLGVEYLQEVLGLSNTWHLLTDIVAWIDAHEGNALQLKHIQQFITENIKLIHHYHDIHAKVIIATPCEALVGSANLTNKGVREREEMSILIKDLSQVGELQDWFNRLWDTSDVLNDMELEKVDSYIKELQLKNKREQGVERKNKLDLRKPKPVIQLPTDIVGEWVGNLQLYTIKDIAFRIADEETLKWTSVRHWIYEKIKYGEVVIYQFKNIELLGEEGVKTLWQLRAQLHTIKKDRNHGTKNSIAIPEGQLLTIKNVASFTEKSVGKIREMVDNQIIRPKFRDKQFLFAPEVVEQIKLLPPEPSGKPKQEKEFSSDKKFLRPLTKLEKFVRDSLKKEPLLSDQQLIDMAHSEGISNSYQRERARQVRDNIAAKEEICKKMGLNLDEVDKSQRINNKL